MSSWKENLGTVPWQLIVHLIHSQLTNDFYFSNARVNNRNVESSRPFLDSDGNEKAAKQKV